MPSFPVLEPELVNQVFLDCYNHSDDGLTAQCEARCLVRCFDFARVKTVHPKECGLPESHEMDGDDYMSWWENPDFCDETEGSLIRTWNVSIIPILKEQYRYLIDYDLYEAKAMIEELINANDK